MQKILGISCFYHDSAAALLVEGKLVAAAQEERFSRLKHDPAFPAQAIQSCLDQAGLTLADIDAVVFYDKPLLKFERLLETFLAHAPFGLPAFCRAMPVWLKEKLLLKTVLRQELMALSGLAKTALPKLLFSQHHQAHAASAFYPSGFDKAVVLCLDGVGEWVTSSVWLGEGNQLTPLQEIRFPHSLGLLYSAFTQYCGFKVNSGEYKLMGLAPYGEPRYVELIYRELIDVKPDGSFSLNMRYFDYPVGNRMINRRFEALFAGPALAFDAAPEQKHLDLARSVQQVVEEVVLKIVRHATALTGCRNLCLAGGVALNCVANGRILAENACDALWVQPAAGDAGGALGAAMLAWHRFYQQPRHAAQPDAMQGAMLGPAYTNQHIEQQLQQLNLPYQRLAAAERNAQVARLLADGAVVGCFQGRMEFGPRALGNRSILADARSADMQRQLNLKIKQRESFRPFAPAVMAEHAHHYFDLTHASPYMLLVAKLTPQQRLPVAAQLQGLAQREQLRSTLPGITHVDYSARVQTVDQQQQPAFYALLQAFYQLTGTAVLINTSFNVRGEPPVCTPEQAIAGFLATDMDYLLLGDYLLHKAEQPESAIQRARQRHFVPD